MRRSIPDKRSVYRIKMVISFYLMSTDVLKFWCRYLSLVSEESNRLSYHPTEYRKVSVARSKHDRNINVQMVFYVPSIS